MRMRRLTQGTGLLLASLLCLPHGAQAGGDPASTQQFDSLYAEITGPASLDISADANAANLERLRTLLPPRRRRARRAHALGLLRQQPLER